MTHPHRDEWVPYVFGEADPAHRQHLESHLKECPTCATELESWRRTLRRMNSWAVPAVRRQTHARKTQVALQWAAAAAVLLLGGFWAGRASTDPTERVRAEVRQEFQAQLASAQQQWAATLKTTQEQTTETMNQFATTMRTEREEDQRALLTMLETMQRQHRADFVTLRRDLETVATLTDQEIRDARRHLIQLTANAAKDDTNQQQ